MIICCDTCPLSPSCEEIAEFDRDAKSMADTIPEDWSGEAMT